MRHAARWADAWYPTGVSDDPSPTRAVSGFRKMVADEGPDPSTVRVAVAPGVLTDERIVEGWARSGVDFVTALALRGDRSALLRELGRFAAMRDSVLGTRVT